MPGGNINGGIIWGGNGIRPPNICGLKPGNGTWGMGGVAAAPGVEFSLLSGSVVFFPFTLSFEESDFSAASPFLDSDDLFSP